MDLPQKKSSWPQLLRKPFDPLPNLPLEVTPTNHTINDGETPALFRYNETIEREGESQKASHHSPPHVSPHEAAVPKLEPFGDQIEHEMQRLASSEVEPGKRGRGGEEGEEYHEKRGVGEGGRGGGDEYELISKEMAAKVGGGGRGGRGREEYELIAIKMVERGGGESDNIEYKDVATATKEVFAREMGEREAMEGWVGGRKEGGEGVDGGEGVKEEARSTVEVLKLKLSQEENERGMNSSEPTSPLTLPPTFPPSLPPSFSPTLPPSLTPSFSPTLPPSLPPSLTPTLPPSFLDNQPTIPETTAAPQSPPEKINSSSPHNSGDSSTSFPRGPIFPPEMREEQLQGAAPEVRMKPKVKPRPVPPPKPKRLKTLSSFDKMAKKGNGGESEERRGSEEGGGGAEGGGREESVFSEEGDTSSESTPTQGVAVGTEERSSKVAAMRTTPTSPPLVSITRKKSRDQTPLSCDETATSHDQTAVTYDKLQPLPAVTAHTLPPSTAHTLQQVPTEYVPKLPIIRAEVERRKRVAKAKEQGLGVGATETSGGGTREVEEGTQLVKEVQRPNLLSPSPPATVAKVNIQAKVNTQVIVGDESPKGMQSSGDGEGGLTSSAATVDCKQTPPPDAELYLNCVRRPPKILMRSRTTNSQQTSDKPLIPIPINPDPVPTFPAVAIPQQPPEDASIQQPDSSPFIPLSPPSPALSSSSSTPPLFPYGHSTDDKATYVKSHTFPHMQLPSVPQSHPFEGDFISSSRTETPSPPLLPIHMKETLEPLSYPSPPPSQPKKKGRRKFKVYDTMIVKFRKSNSEEKKKTKQTNKETSPENAPPKQTKLKKSHSDAPSQQTTIKNPRSISPRHAPSELKDRNTNATSKQPPPSSKVQPPLPSSTVQLLPPSLTAQLPRQTFLNMQTRPLPLAPYHVDDEEGFFHTLEDYEFVPSSLCPPENRGGVLHLEAGGGVYGPDITQSLPAHILHSSQTPFHPLREEKQELPQDDGDYVNEDEFPLLSCHSPHSAFQLLPEWKKGGAPVIGSRNLPSSSAFPVDVRAAVPKQRQESSSELPDYDYPDMHILGLAVQPARLPPPMAAPGTRVVLESQREVMKMSAPQHRQIETLPPRHLTRQLSYGTQSVDESDDYVHMSPKATDDNYVNWETQNWRRKHLPSSSAFRRHSLEDLRMYMNLPTTKISVPPITEKSCPMKPSQPSIIALPPRHILRKQFQAVSVEQKTVNPQLLEPQKSVVQPSVTPAMSPRPKPRKTVIQNAPTTRAPTTQSLSPSQVTPTQPTGGKISTSMTPSPVPSPRSSPKRVTQMPPQVLQEASLVTERDQSNEYYNVLSKDLYCPPSKKLNSNSDSSYPLTGDLHGKQCYLELLP